MKKLLILLLLGVLSQTYSQAVLTFDTARSPYKMVTVVSNERLFISVDNDGTKTYLAVTEKLKGQRFKTRHARYPIEKVEPDSTGIMFVLPGYQYCFKNNDGSGIICEDIPASTKCKCIYWCKD